MKGANADLENGMPQPSGISINCSFTLSHCQPSRLSLPVQAVDAILKKDATHCICMILWLGQKTERPKSRDIEGE
jgi:hypothetical protein